MTKTRGHLFQGRFYSCPLNTSHIIAAARYVERNSIRAKLCDQREDYRWSSARYHLDLEKPNPLTLKKTKASALLRSGPSGLYLIPRISRNLAATSA